MKSCKITNILLSPYDDWVRGRQEIPLTLRGPSVPRGDSSDIIKYIYIPGRLINIYCGKNMDMLIKLTFISSNRV